MGRIAQNAEKYSAADFVKEINACKAYRGIKTDRQLAELAGMSPSTICLRKKNPMDFSIGELRRMIPALKMDGEAILRLLGYTTKDIRAIGKRYAEKQEVTSA